MVRLACWFLALFPVLSLLGWASNAHVFFDVVRMLAFLCLMTSLTLFLVAYLRTPDLPDGDRP